MSEFGVTQIDYVLGPDGYELKRSEPPRTQTVSPEGMETGDLEAAIAEANQNYMIVPDGSGRWHEMTIFNAGQEKRMTKPSTSGSGLLKNPGNLLETAVLATLNPEYEIAYWTSFGNYPTGRMTKGERGYRNETGRYTTGSGTEANPYRPLDSIKYLVEMFDKQGLMPTHFTADQEAGRLALAIMAALPENSIQGAHLNGIDGLSHDAHYVRDDTISDLASRARRRRIGKGKAEELTPFNIKNVKRQAPTIYHGPQKYLHLPPVFFVLAPDIIDALQNLQSRRGHDDLDNLADHAVYHDARAALFQQETTLTIRVNQDGGQTVEECERFGQELVDHIPETLRSDKRSVRLLIGEVGRTANTDAPAESARAAGHALDTPEDRRNKMVAWPGGLTVSRIFDLTAPVRAA